MAWVEKAQWHKNVTPAAICEAVERSNTSLDDPGFCLICGCEAGGCEPDARDYECESCGAPAVYGAKELMFHLCDEDFCEALSGGHS